MAKKPTKKSKRLKDLEMIAFWDRHIESVRPDIKALDRKDAEALAKAPLIVVTNEAKSK